MARMQAVSAVCIINCGWDIKDIGERAGIPQTNCRKLHNGSGCHFQHMLKEVLNFTQVIAKVMQNSSSWSQLGQTLHPHIPAKKKASVQNGKGSCNPRKY
jgi:hypothetical protein